jgi:4-amino-4-deoxy-L-arabinose transferase-like glycosyltransferase
MLGADRPYYPPAVYALLGTALGLTSFRLDTSIALVNLAYSGVLLSSTYLLGRDLWSARAGGLAAGLVALYPAVFVHARAPMLDLPLAAITTASVLALVRSDAFRDRRWVLAFGAVAGLGCLTKQAYLFAIAGSLVLAVAMQVRTRTQALHLVASLTLAAAIALPWYAPRLDWFLGDYADIQSNYARSRGDPETLSALGLAYYIIGTWHQTSVVLALAWVATLPWFLRSRERAMVTAWWIGTVVLSTTLDLKDSRFLMPALPAIALMTARGLDLAWCGKRGRSLVPALVAAATLFGGAQVWSASFEAPLPARGVVFKRVEPDERLHVLPANYRLALNNTSRADREGWGIVDAIEPLSGRVGIAGNYFIRDAVRLPALIELGATGEAQRLVIETGCPAGPDSGLDALVIQVGGRDAPADAASCAGGMREVARVPLHAQHLLPGAREIVIFVRD